MFGGLTVQDTMSDFLGQLFRIPVDGAPVSIIELGGLPAEVAQVIVSVVTRLAFEFGLWSHGAAPLAIIVEDAHRYAPAQEGAGFAPTRKALVRIAKEGRKVGVSLWVASQRPTELDATVLSQCNTIFAMRLANQADQEALKSAVPDASTSLLSCLPSLGLGEAIAVGEGVPLPTRIRFDALPREAVPRSLTASFTDGWSVDVDDKAFISRIVEQWRAQKMLIPDV
jgi:DNA helicase HerA-like ATPase